jgi:hypothetical protein
MSIPTSHPARLAPARVFGILLLLAFVAYGTGNGLVAYAIGDSNDLAHVHAHKVHLVAGAVLMGLVHMLLIFGMAAIMTSLLKYHGKIAAYGYLAMTMTSGILLAVGAVFLLLLGPLSEAFSKAAASEANNLQALGLVFQKANFFFFQTGMGVWGFGGLILCYLLYRSRLLPKFIPAWGFIGYLIFISGTILEVFGYEAGLFLNIPGGLFEVFLGFWLIAKGLRPAPVAAIP